MLTANGEVMIEKHWAGVVSRTVCDQFWNEATKSRSMQALPTLITLPKFYLIHIREDDVILLGVISNETAPLLCLEFLHTLTHTFTSYFGAISSDTIKDNFITVYQLLDEMMDSGFPMNTEPNVLREMVLKPTIINRMLESVSTNPSSVSARLPEGAVSNIPWRKKGVRYAHNEVYFDIVESLDFIANSAGQQVMSHVWGEILCDSKLSGTPDILIDLSDASVLEDFSFHPCVRYSRFIRNKQLSFVPPDGQFRLCTYSYSREIEVPLYVNPTITIDSESNRVQVQLLVGSRFVGKKSIQGIVVTVPFPKGLSGSKFTVNHGTCSFDEISKVLTWQIGALTKDTTPQLTGSLKAIDKSTDVHCRPIIQVEFKIPKETLSGLRIENLSVVNEKYKPYKGMRTLTKAGRFEIRT